VIEDDNPVRQVHDDVQLVLNPEIIRSDSFTDSFASTLTASL
jgi:hypothetical protein